MAPIRSLGKPVGLGVLNDLDKIDVGLQGLAKALTNKNVKQGIKDAKINAKDLRRVLKTAIKDGELLYKTLDKTVLPMVLSRKKKKRKVS